MEAKKYKMQVTRGAFINPSFLDTLGAKTIEKLDRSEWQSIDEITVDLKQIRELQEKMTRHYDDTKIPWYMDGHGIDNKNDIIVAFGADDGEGGKIFQFARDDKAMIAEVVEYGVSKGIPREEMDFMGIDL